MLTRSMAGGIVVLTGAGISKESGLDTFRDAGGIWSRVRLEDVATPEAFARNPERVHAFYNVRRRALLSPAIAPNAAHLALADLERKWNGDFLLVTQNIDDLHERAGSVRLLHMHGELLNARCARCGQVRRNENDLATASACPDCGTAGSMRPDVVWFGEMPFEMDRIGAALARCDLFIAIGTSGNVYPAAGFIAEARSSGARTIELNLEPSERANDFVEHRYGRASRIVPELVAELIQTR